MLAACGSAAPRPAVALLPDPGAGGAGVALDRPVPPWPRGRHRLREAAVLGFAQLNGDEWNLGGTGGSGSLDMSVGSHGAVTINGQFASTPPCTASTCLAPSAYTWVRGYPDVTYGINQCHAATSPAPSPGCRCRCGWTRSRPS